MHDEDISPQIEETEDSPHVHQPWRPAPYDSTGFGNALLCFVSVVCVCAIVIDCLESYGSAGIVVAVLTGIVGTCTVGGIAAYTFHLERRRRAHSRSHVVYPWIATIALFVVWGLSRGVLALAS